jgi:hypothetical protein
MNSDTNKSGLPVIIDPNITAEVPIEIAVSDNAASDLPLAHEVFEHSVHCLLHVMQVLPLLYASEPQFMEQLPPSKEKPDSHDRQERELQSLQLLGQD